MIDGANSKIDRAVKLISEVREVLLEENLFHYIVQTNILTGERILRSDVNDIALSEVSVICGEVLHLIRSALDHAYWAVVSPVAAGNPSIEKKIQFPFSQSSTRLESEVKSRMAEKVGENFYKAIIDLRPHGDRGGNLYLYLIHILNIPDKHKYLIPIGDYKKVDLDAIKKKCPDFPSYMSGSFFASGNGRGDVRWTARNKLDLSEVGRIVPPTTHLYKLKVNAKIDAVFSVKELEFRGEVISTLCKFVDVAKEAIKIIREAAK